MLKNIIVYDTDDFELVPFQNGINNAALVSFELCQRPENINLNKHRNGIWDEIKRYFNYFHGGYYLFTHREEYLYIICWQQFYAITYAFFCNILRKKSQCKVIACNYTYKEKKGIVKKLYYWFMKKSLEGETINHIHVLSNTYADWVCSELQYDRKNVIVSPFGILDEYDRYSQLEAPAGFEENGYFLAIGRSNRDYDFLIEVWETIDFPLVIISDKYKGTTNNSNIVIRRDVGAEDQYQWINNCLANIICLEDCNIASGDTVLLTAMSLERINIVSKPSTLAEMYITNGENGISVKKRIIDFRQEINKIISGEYSDIGRNARRVFLQNFSRISMGEAIGKYIR